MELDNQTGYQKNSGLESYVNQEHVFESEEKGLFRKVTDIYFKPKSFEKWRNGKIYEFIGIKPFKKFVLWTTDKIPPRRKRKNELKGSNYYIGKDISQKSLKKFEKKTRYNEFVHGGGAGFMIYQAGGLLKADILEIKLIGIFVGSLILASVYLVCLQRYHRTRVHNVLERKEKLKNRNEKVSKSSILLK